MIRYRTADYFITPEDWQEWSDLRDAAHELTHNPTQDMTNEDQRTEDQQIPEERGLR